MPDVPDGESGEWGFGVYQYMGYVDGVPQHVGQTYAAVGKAGSGANYLDGDWSHEGELFSDRAGTISHQPPYVPG